MKSKQAINFKGLGVATLLATSVVTLAGLGHAAGNAPAAPKAVVATVPGMPPVLDSENLYSETRADQILPEVKKDLERVYVPNLRGNSVWVIDPATLKVVDKFKVKRLKIWDMV